MPKTAILRRGDKNVESVTGTEWHELICLVDIAIVLFKGVMSLNRFGRDNNLMVTEISSHRLPF